ncbi:hypothetical protein QBC47DRAFT_393163 [Echria macrotheca]|uniref:RRM domain-containing protein n=1 Tax=Echria macrotheca TaxID=438768 RepID=A0AAJ0B2U9_9PEZI|nr:hypothetical protein QBC47DRAFT_393163 [Echria macrotheca]
MAASNDANRVATDFEKIINEARDRKKNEALAKRIFGQDRRSSTPTNVASSSPGAGSLASRAGVKKRTTGPPTRPRHSTGNVDGEWVHDLHTAQDPKQQPKPGSLAARISNPNLPQSAAAAARRPNPRSTNRLANALNRTPELNRTSSPSNSFPPPRNGASTVQPPTGPRAQRGQQPQGQGQQPQPQSQGITIRGLAGPFVCLAQNFAPGTTAADIESAMTPVSGVIHRVRIVKTSPIVIAEVTFANKDGADRAIKTFDGQTADGRVIRVYPKPGNQETPDSQIVGSGPRSMVVDGTLGFDDPMDTADGYSRGGPPAAAATDAAVGGLYSDDVMRTNRRGRGFNRSGGY